MNMRMVVFPLSPTSGLPSASTPQASNTGKPKPSHRLAERAGERAAPKAGPGTGSAGGGGGGGGSIRALPAP